MGEPVPEKKVEEIESRLESLEKKTIEASKKQLTDFLLKDFELKIRYLSDHFTRMWNRFNYFVAIESALIALIGGKFIAGREALLLPLVLTGGVLSLLWYVFGAQDRWLVRLYRTQAEEAAKKVDAIVETSDHSWTPASDYQFYTGSTRVGEDFGEKSADDIFRNTRVTLTAWRWEKISVTRLAALFPLFTFLIWSLIFIVLVTGWPDWLATPLLRESTTAS